MADTTPPPATDTSDTRAELEEKPESSDFWLRELSAAGKRDENWIKRARKVVQRYRDERDKGPASEKRANILWSNTELLKSALFQGLGNPDVRRRYPKRGKDEKNTKQAALVMERAVGYSQDAYDCESQIEACVEDMVLPGRGVAWVVYDAEFKANEETQQDEIAYQSVKDQHVFWEDYRTSSGREEGDIWWKARRHNYSRDELKQFFPKHWDKIPLNAQLAGTDSDKRKKDEDSFRRSSCWEIWDKDKKQRIYVAEDYPLVLKREEDPYRLQSFFPCPPPLYGCKTTSDLEPIPEFTLYQDQADELDVISTRLSFLIDALRRRGVYDAGAEGTDGQLSRLAMAKDNEFLPFKGFSGLIEKGGLKNVFQTEDLKPAIDAIQQLTARGAVLIQQIYEITGISDIMRGASNADETATAQSIKANFGSMRLQKRQKRVQRFIRDLARIKAELAAEHFSREQLQEMTGVELPLQAEKQAIVQQLAALQQQAQMAQAPQQAPQGGPPEMMGHNGGPPMMGAQPPPPPDPEMVQELERIAKLPTWEDVAAILRSDLRRGYKIDVETDQTAQVDALEEKNSRIEFMSTMQQMLEKAIPMAMQLPPMRPLIKESTMFVVKAFKAGRPLEEAFDEAFSALEKMPPPQNNGDPVADAKAQQIQTDTKLSIQEAQAKAQVAQVDAAAKQQAAQADMAVKALDIQGKQQDQERANQDAAAERAIKAKEAQIRIGRAMTESEMDLAMQRANADLADNMGRIEQEEAWKGLLAQDEDRQMTRAERIQKMRHAEKAANRPQPTNS